MPELPRLEWKGSSVSASSRVISFLKARHMAEKGCLAYLAHVWDTTVETPAIDLVPVVWEFSVVFPFDLPGMPPDRDINFCIDLALEGRVIVYASRQLKPHKKNYQVHDLELATIVHALKIWRRYLYGVSCEVYIDHRSLQHLFKQRDFNLRAQPSSCMRHRPIFTIPEDQGLTVRQSAFIGSQRDGKVDLGATSHSTVQKALDLSFMVGEKVLLKVSLMMGIMRFRKKGKLSPRFIGPFELLRRVGDVAYELAFPPSLSVVHPIFHVSMLRRYHADRSHVLDFSTIQLDESLGFEEEPVAIVDWQVHQLISKKIYVVKVRWRGQPVEEVTWEIEEDMQSRYPHLFGTPGTILDSLEDERLFKRWRM
ncbi:uncharacterized protein [Nicotiana tomentosiformis]|uniref:uncharacterized protein n=1 Tax=Nicotiana tomentosiformis TaxID=4098 RepID=UPI00388C9653